MIAHIIIQPLLLVPHIAARPNINSKYLVIEFKFLLHNINAKNIDIVLALNRG